jgi:hypothetical protein
VTTALVLLSACETTEWVHAPWTFDVPAGTVVREAVPLPFEQRSALIQLREEWAVGGDDAGPQYMFATISDVGVAPDGRVYVVDGPNHRVQVLDSQGRYVTTIGGVEGNGPGELSAVVVIASVEDRIVLSHGRGRNRLSAWDPEGDFLWERNLHLPRSLIAVAGLPGDEFVGYRYGPLAEPGRSLVMIAKFSPEGEELLTYATVVQAGSILLSRPGLIMNALLPRPRPTVAATADGDVYITRGDEYQVLAFDDTGKPRWALRGRWTRIPIERAEVVEAMARLREGVPDVLESEIDWPPSHPALSVAGGREERRFASIAVDGHGHLYVFPFFRESAIAPENSPVDVYSRNGELLFSGLIERRNWIVAKGDHVYGMQLDPTSQEEMVAKYRLIEPF